MTGPAPSAGGSPTGALDARLVVRRGRFSLDLALTAAPGEVVALLGPNGAGKSTALRSLAGLVPLDEGHVRLDGAVLEDTGAGVRVPAEDRPVGVVFQDYLLFPHLSALENVAFGPRCRGAGRRTARAEALDWLARLGVAEQASVRPGRLSGGQAQRVALARALAVRPRLLLLDEPLAALDARTRLEVRAELRHRLAALAAVAVLVSHDPLDAMVLADRLVVVEDGRAVQAGTPAEVARRPRTEYVARLAGLNLYRGTAQGRLVRLRGRPEAVVTTAEELAGPVFVAFAPSAVTVLRERPVSSARNVWPVRVTGLDLHGDRVRVALAGELELSADLTTAAVAELGLTAGAEVWASVKATQVRAYPA